MYELPFKGKISKIYHISDIHIRKSTSRYAEYQHVFNNLYKYLNSKSGGIVVISGDIVHDKLDISNEQIKFLGSFLKSITNLMPCLITLGNHDCVIGTPDRMSSLKPVVSFLQNQRHPIYLAEKSGEYVFKDSRISFGITSPFVNEDFVLANTLSSCNKRIGILHASMNQTTFKFNKNLDKIGLNHLDGYDMVLLGDIHQRNFITPTVAYAGSLIQQSLNESPYHHGLIEWNLCSNSGKFIDIPSDYGMYNIRFYNGKWSNIDKLSKYSHLTVSYNSSKPSGQDMSVLKSATVIKSIKYKNTSRISKFETNIVRGNQSLGFEAQLDYLKSFLIQEKTPDDVIKKVINLHKMLNKQYLPNTEQTEAEPWSITKVSFSNFMRFRGCTTIDFARFEPNSVISINGLNASGKSTIIDAILFGLFAKTPRMKKLQSMMYIDPITNKIASECTVVLDILKGTKSYTITRKIKNNKFTATGKIEIHHNNSCLFSESAQSNKWIVQNLSTYDNLLQTFFLTQSAKSFFDTNPTDIINIFNNKFNLGSLEAVRVHMKSELKTIKTKINEKQDFVNQVNSIELKQLRLDSDELESKLNAVKQLIKPTATSSDLSSIIDYWNSNTRNNHDMKLKNLMRTMETNSTNIFECNANIRSTISNINRLSAELNQLNVDIQSVAESYDSLVALKYWESADIIQHFNDTKIIKSSITALDMQISESNIKIQDLEINLCKLNELVKFLSTLTEGQGEVNEQSAVPVRYATTVSIATMCSDIDALFNSPALTLESKHDKLIKIYTIIDDKINQIINSIDKPAYNLILDYKKRFNKLLDEYKKAAESVRSKSNTLRQIDVFEKQVQQMEMDLKLKGLEMKSLKASRKEFFGKLEKLEAYLNKYKESQHYLKNLEIRSEKDKTMNKMRAKLIEYNTERIELTRNQVETKKQMELLHLYENSYESAKLHSNKLKQQELYKLEYHNTESRLNETKAKLSVHQEYLDRNKIILKELSGLREEQHYKLIYSKLIDNRSKFLQRLTSHLCEIVEQRINEKLRNIPIANLEINITRLVKEFEIKFKYCNELLYRSVGYASGFEKAILDLCFRTVWCDLGLMNPCHIYVLDEPLTSVDFENKKHFDELFDVLKTQFDYILLISHIPEILSIGDYTLNVIRAPNSSIIV
eukprot:NODE_207_length_14754_cov_0.677994.p1 type:complete len:1160 gc:universal NODE_207_length_14754_cov_0.677994:13833-10354(-)